MKFKWLITLALWFHENFSFNPFVPTYCNFQVGFVQYDFRALNKGIKINTNKSFDAQIIQ